MTCIDLVNTLIITPREGTDNFGREGSVEFSIKYLRHQIRDSQ